MCEDACFLCRSCGIIVKNGRLIAAPTVGSEVWIMDLPKRKRIRLPNYDYSSPGANFITICTKEKRCTLSDIAVGAAISRPPEVRLTRYGEIVDLAIRNIPSVYPNVSVDHSVIMPNHIHLILRLHHVEGGRMISAPTVSTVVGQMKRWASKQAGTALWQKSYHEHVIRNEDDYRQIWEYIENNPARWVEDRYYIEGEHSADGEAIE